MPKIDVVMAVHQPEMAALERQIATVLSQNDCKVRLHLFADGPMPELPLIRALADRHDQLSLVAFADNRGPATTFLEGLAHLLEQPSDSPGERWFAFCDQDDLWHPDKLAVSLARLQQSGAACVHSDARVVDVQQRLVASSVFKLEQRAYHPGLTALFFRNNATGMTMLFDEPLALKVTELRRFRPQRWLHDHFVAFLAACSRGLTFEDRALTDYIQHGDNVVGAGRAITKLPSGDFLDPCGDAARWLASGEKLVRALLADASLAAPAREEIEQLEELLCTRGIRSLRRILGLSLRKAEIPRGLYARLFWSKLTR